MLFWLAAVTAGGVFAARLLRSADAHHGPGKTIASVTRFVTRRQTVVEQIDPTSRLRPGDPVFLADDEGDFRQVGLVSQLSGPVSGKPLADRPISIRWYDPDVSADACQMFQYHSTGRLSEVVETLLPPERAEEHPQPACGRDGTAW